MVVFLVIKLAAGGVACSTGYIPLATATALQTLIQAGGMYTADIHNLDGTIYQGA